MFAVRGDIPPKRCICVYAIFLAGISRNIRTYTVHIYESGQPYIFTVYHIFTPIIIVYLVISLPKVPCMHCGHISGLLSCTVRYNYGFYGTDRTCCNTAY
jgi:hypothetical protein